MTPRATSGWATPGWELLNRRCRPVAWNSGVPQAPEATAKLLKVAFSKSDVLKVAFSRWKLLKVAFRNWDLLKVAFSRADGLKVAFSTGGVR